MSATPKVPYPRPEVLGGPVPYLILEGALSASELYQRAFDAREVGHVPPDDKGRTMHVHLYVNGGGLSCARAGADVSRGPMVRSDIFNMQTGAAKVRR